MTLRDTADQIIRASLRAVQPDAAVQRALQEFSCAGRVVLIAIGKAAWAMANAAWDTLSTRITSGAVITKYGHSRGPIGPLQIFEAGHPVPDEAGLHAAQAALELTRGLREEDCVLFLISGGGSALFESPLVPLAELEDITGQLLSCGADIVEINTIRKRLSAVKGGRFALHCRPAPVFSVVLSDILGDPLDMIASGPAAPDSSTCAEALAVVRKYGLRLSDRALACLQTETPKALPNAVSRVTGSVRALCDAAEHRCIRLTDCLSCEAREAGRFLAAVARTHASPSEPLAFLAGGETVVHLTGSGRGGRNQEVALAAAEGLAGLAQAAVFSFGSDGTDGPTDAAGGFVDQDSFAALRAAGLDPADILRRNDAYPALERIGGLIHTGPTGTNVNDLAMLLLPRRE